MEVRFLAKNMKPGRREKAMRIPSSVIAGAALITGFVFGSMFHTTKVQARNHMAAHIEQVFEIPTGREVN